MSVPDSNGTMRRIGGNIRDVFLVSKGDARHIRKVVGPDRKLHAESEIGNLAAFCEGGVSVPRFLGRSGDNGYDYEYIDGVGYEEADTVSDAMLESLAATGAHILGACAGHADALNPLSYLPGRLCHWLEKSTRCLAEKGLLAAFEPHLDTIGHLLEQPYTSCALCDMYVSQFIYHPGTVQCFLIDAEYVAALDPLYGVAGLVTSMLNAGYAEDRIGAVRFGIEREYGKPIDWARVGLWCGFNDMRFYTKHHASGKMPKMLELCEARIAGGTSVRWSG
jgi:hypothetical protein